MDAWFQINEATKIMRFAWAATLSDPTNYGGTALQWGMWVMYPGDSLSIQTAAGTADFAAAGYVLTAP
jgi:hypothetical protein